MRSEAAGRLSEIARFQWGLVTARQAAAEGIQRWDLSRLTADGVLEKAGHGVYHVTGAPHTTHLGLCVAWLQLAPALVAEERDIQGGVVSCTSAAVLHGIGDFEPEPYEFTCPVRKRTRREDVLIHTASLNSGDVQWLDQLPVTTPIRTIQDLFADRHDGGHIGRAMADLLQVGAVSRAELEPVAAPFAEFYGLPGGDGAQLVAHLMTLGGLPANERRTA